MSRVMALDPLPGLRRLVAGLCASLACACSSGPPRADLGEIYNEAAQRIGTDRNPVVVLPGILGSKLEQKGTGRLVWGAFVRGAADADYPSGARLVALPMERATPLSQLVDDVHAVDVLDRLEVDLALVARLRIGAYVDILRTLAAGAYRDESLARGSDIDYGGLHFTCFQFPYDWRRDCSEQAKLLHEQLVRASNIAAEAMGVPPDVPVKLDVVAHSMGGLVLRYYLRYGTQPLPEDGSLPPLTWDGAELVRRAILVATPNGGSNESLERLIEGLDVGLFAPNYRAAILGTMPAIYQLLPRTRHGRIVDRETGETLDMFDVATWERFEWGLASPKQRKVLRWLLPDAASDEERREIALDHLAKCLARAEQFHRALDVDAEPPDGLEMALFCGDALDTPAVYEVGRRGRPKVRARRPGDGTVTRDSALMDERTGGEWRPRLDSPIAWDRVQFLAADHLDLTRSIEFSDNLLYLLLEDPR